MSYHGIPPHIGEALLRILSDERQTDRLIKGMRRMGAPARRARERREADEKYHQLKDQSDRRLQEMRDRRLGRR